MTTEIFSIKGHCGITQNSVLNDAQPKFELPGKYFEQFIEDLYRHYKIYYPKFYKMDNLSKLGFVTAEILLRNVKLKEKVEADRIGIILSNKSSSLDTDVKYNAMVKNGVASPAIFVYSLPNIVIGEICIRHGIKGENAFFVSDEYDIPFQVNYTNNLLKNRIIDQCICGWVELIGENYDSFLYLVENEKNENAMIHPVGWASYGIHSVKNVESIYKNQEWKFRN